MQPARNHQMQHQPHIVVEPDGDTLADPAQLAHAMAFRIRDGRLRRAQQERAGDPNALQRLTDDAFFQRT